MGEIGRGRLGGPGPPPASLQAPTDYAGLYAAWNVDGDGAADDLLRAKRLQPARCGALWSAVVLKCGTAVVSTTPQ